MCLMSSPLSDPHGQRGHIRHKLIRLKEGEATKGLREMRSKKCVRSGAMPNIWIEVCLLLLSLTNAQADGCLTAIIGETMQIPCSLNTEESLKTEDISIEWQKANGPIVHAFYKGEDNLSNQDSQFKGRTQLFRSELSRGNFSLGLSNVSVSDEGEFECKYSRAEEKSSRLLYWCHLQVTGRYSEPVVYRSASPVSKNSEVHFTCKSTGGFPEPKVHWSVNKEPHQNSRRVNTTLSRDSRGLYSVTSVLTVNVTGDVSVTCTVENERLGENTTSPENRLSEKEPNRGNGRAWAVGGSVLVVVLLLGGSVMFYKLMKRQHGERVPRTDIDTTAPISKHHEAEQL
ncbi:ICOS ligand-like [Polypterus senegalus]|uniref:ICOS ligand-like n=1 Tax=Polypterus senegalus TaxID=55291 RepID=UPI0019662E98|nr:ICOS ligand-like [Polypterus senegalus]